MRQGDTNGRDDRAFRGLAPALFAAALIGIVGLYVWSIVDVARGPQDWLMIVPAGLICIAALLWAGMSDVVAERREGSDVRARDRSVLPPVLLGLICLYAPATAIIGFDIATAVFIFVTLVVQGERHILRLAIASFGGTALLLYIFTELLAVRLPATLI